MVHTNISKDIFQQALISLGDNKLRTILSILGISVGIAAVMAVGSVTQGVREYIYAELETYGLRTIWLYRDRTDEDPNRAIRQGSGISNDDYLFLKSSRCCPSIKQVTPQVYASGQVSVRIGSEFFKPNLEGVGVEYLDLNQETLARGRGFRNDDIERKGAVAILAPEIAKEMFGVGNPMGKSFRFKDQKFTIIGILKKKSREILDQINVDSYDPNKRILIPFTTYQSIMGWPKDVHTLLAEAHSLEATVSGMEELKSALNRRNGARFKYKTENMQGWIDNAENYVADVRNVGLTLAALALFVGGMGIMNIMTTSVIERTREIGIRKALGAQREDILFQFLMEATVVSTIGGIIGLVLGTIATYIIGYLMGYAFKPYWLMAIIAIVVSALVGMMSGYYPARRAARMNPIDALRFE